MRAPAAQLRLLRLRGQRQTVPAAERPAREAVEIERPPRALRMRWVIVGCLAVSGLTLLLPATPTYDPWAWLLWGRQIVELDLVTDFGPSWKPLPMVFIVPFQAIGQLIGEDSFAPYAWLWIARAGGLLACVMVFRLARRLVGGGPLGTLAGVIAFAALFSSFKFVRDSALGNSEPLMAALVLLAFERHLDGRRDHALYLAAGAALMRPEIWLFLGLYGLWLWVREPRLRVPMVGLAVVIPALWFLPEWWGSGNPFRAGERARDPRASSPAFADFPAGEILRRYKSTVIEPVAVAGLIAIGVAAARFFRRLGSPQERRRDWATLVLAGGGVAWLVLIAIMTQAKFAGNQRYLIIPTAALAVLAGIGVVRLVQGAMQLAARRFDERTVRVVAIATVALGLAASGPAIAFKLDNADTIRDALAYEADLWSGLKDGINEVGGRDAVKSCGQVYSGAFQTQMLAYELHLKGRDITYAGEGTEHPPLPVTKPPGTIFRTRTAEHLSPVPPIRDGPWRKVAESGPWGILASADGASTCRLTR